MAMLLAVAAALAAAISPQAQGGASMSITRKTDLKTTAGPAEFFTGEVTITGQFQREAPARHGGAIVRFQPGARTNWHTHPAGQTLIVTEGVGWTQIDGGPKLTFREGDVLWCPAEHRHWHGATPHGPMTHIAIQENVDGSPVTWMEPVSDETYLGSASDESDES